MADWEAFGRSILERFCEGDSEIEMMDIQDMAENYGTLIPIEGGFDPDKHIDVTGACERGDPFFNVAPKEPK